MSEKPQSFNDLCPQVLFSKDHRIYITTEENSLTINNISYKAEMNNYNFTHGCILLNNEISAKLSILFIVKPENAKQTDIIMPYYIALLDDQKNIVNIQYYTAQGVLKKNFDESSYIETEITTTNVKLLRDITDWYMERNPTGIIVIGSVTNSSVSLIVRLGKILVERGLNAGSIVSTISTIVDGKGGGSPTLGQGGGSNPQRLHSYSFGR